VCAWSESRELRVESFFVLTVFFSSSLLLHHTSSEIETTGTHRACADAMAGGKVRVMCAGASLFPSPSHPVAPDDARHAGRGPPVRLSAIQGAAQLAGRGRGDAAVHGCGGGGGRGLERGREGCISKGRRPGRLRCEEKTCAGRPGDEPGS